MDTHLSEAELLGLLEDHQIEVQAACIQMDTDPGVKNEVRVMDNFEAANASMPKNTDQIPTLNWPEINALLAGQNAHLNISKPPINTLISTPYGISQAASANQVLSLKTALTSNVQSTPICDVVTPLPLPPHTPYHSSGMSPLTRH
jgi:hypothetical protein